MDKRVRANPDLQQRDSKEMESILLRGEEIIGRILSTIMRGRGGGGGCNPKEAWGMREGVSQGILIKTTKQRGRV